MAIELPPLPWEKNALAPHISEETIDYHYGYVNEHAGHLSIQAGHPPIDSFLRLIPSLLPSQHSKHHAAYVTKLNGLIKGTEYEGKSVEEIMLAAPAGGLFNNAAQVWNHNFYWNCLKPNGGGVPTGKIAALIDRDLGGYEAFR